MFWKWLSINWFKLSVIIFFCLITYYLFNWFELRPASLISACGYEAQWLYNPSPDALKSQTEDGVFYSCLHKKGIR